MIRSENTKASASPPQVREQMYELPLEVRSCALFQAFSKIEKAKQSDANNSTTCK